MLTHTRRTILRLTAATSLIAGLLALATVAGSPYWQDVFAASFDKASNDPSTWAEIGTVSTVPSCWGRATTGDSGVKWNELVLTSDNGDASADVGFHAVFSPAVNTGVCVASWEITPHQISATFQGMLGIDKGGDIVGLTFGGDGSISIPGRPERFAYLAERTYVCWLMATFLSPSSVSFDVAVQDKSTGVTIANWSFAPDQPVASLGRLTLLRKGGALGTFDIDSVKTSWLVSNSGK